MFYAMKTPCGLRHIKENKAKSHLKTYTTRKTFLFFWSHFAITTIFLYRIGSLMFMRSIAEGVIGNLALCSFRLLAKKRLLWPRGSDMYSMGEEARVASGYSRGSVVITSKVHPPGLGTSWSSMYNNPKTEHQHQNFSLIHLSTCQLVSCSSNHMNINY